MVKKALIDMSLLSPHDVNCRSKSVFFLSSISCCTSWCGWLTLVAYNFSAVLLCVGDSVSAVRAGFPMTG